MAQCPWRLTALQGSKASKASKARARAKEKSWDGWGFGAGAGKAGSGWNSWNNSKGKQKGKGKKGKKGKSKGGKPGKGKSNCRICGQPGHWGNECPNRGHVNQVEAPQQQQQFASPHVQVTQQGAPFQQPAQNPVVPQSQARSYASTTVPSSAASGSVRQVRLYHVATPPDGLEKFDIASEGSEEWYARMVQSATSQDWYLADCDGPEHFFIGDEEPQEHGEWDEWSSWFHDDSQMCVRAVRDEADLIVLGFRG